MKPFISKDLIIYNGYNNIFVIINRFTKFFYFIFYNENINAKQLAYTFLKHIVAIHNLLKKIIFDKEITFVFKF